MVLYRFTLLQIIILLLSTAHSSRTSTCIGFHGQGKYFENDFFTRLWKVREIYDWSRKFGKDLKIQGIFCY